MGPDGRNVSIPAKTRVVLSEFYLRYVPNLLTKVRSVAPELKNKPIKRAIINEKNISPRIKEAKKPRPISSGQKAAPSNVRSAKSRAKSNFPSRVGSISQHRGPSRSKWRHKTVGRAVTAGASASYAKVVSNSCVPISNNIGVGILSYNRFEYLKRCIESIKKHTDLKKTTVFVSDDASSNFTEDQKAWLLSQDLIVLLNTTRLGVAGNTNRLLKCLDRFKYKILLNDDVEILKPRWDLFYFEAMAKTNITHFCYREPGIYGALSTDGYQRDVNGVLINTIKTKPHGAVLAIDHDTFEAVGFLDEQFGLYGMEHVDWSTRIARKTGRLGYHDVNGSEAYFKIHPAASAVDDRQAALANAKALFKEMDSPNRIYIAPSDKSEVPSLSVVIPFRDAGRLEGIESVVLNIKAQRFPRIEIMIAEEDRSSKVRYSSLYPVKSLFLLSNGQFNKSRAFNNGVANCKYDKIILHDADILVPGDYADSVAKMLKDHESCHLGSEVYYLNVESTTALNNQHYLSPDYTCTKIVTYFEGGSLGVTKSGYVKAGGFDERFEGYGVEDCAFYTNLAQCTRFKNDRRFKFFHLWHDRVDGWQQCHERNKAYYAQVLKGANVQSYALGLTTLLKSRYKI